MSKTKRTEIIETFISTGKISDQVLNLYDLRQLLKILSDLDKRIDALDEIQRLNGFNLERRKQIDQLNHRAGELKTMSIINIIAICPSPALKKDCESKNSIVMRKKLTMFILISSAKMSY